MLKLVTFTGVDDATDIARLLELSRRNDFIEWGVLIPMKGHGRWPSPAKVAELVGRAELAPFDVQLAAHICEPLVGELLMSETRLMNLIGTAFSRVQINTHGHLYPRADDWPENVLRQKRREIILQLDGVTSNLLINDLADVFAEGEVAGLFDLSHGAGVLPASWDSKKPPLRWLGYAGGLGPNNLAEQLPRIQEAAGDASYWIDMETHVRTNGFFDLDKVEQCIAIVRAFVQTQLKEGATA